MTEIKPRDASHRIPSNPVKKTIMQSHPTNPSPRDPRRRFRAKCGESPSMTIATTRKDCQLAPTNALKPSVASSSQLPAPNRAPALSLQSLRRLWICKSGING